MTDFRREGSKLIVTAPESDLNSLKSDIASAILGDPSLSSSWKSLQFEIDAPAPTASASIPGDISWFSPLPTSDSPTSDYDIRIPPEYQPHILSTFSEGKRMFSPEVISPLTGQKVILAFRLNQPGDPTVVHIRPSKALPMDRFGRVCLTALGFTVEGDTPPTLSSFAWRAAKYLSLCYDIPLEDFSTDIRKIPEFLPELYGVEYEFPPVEDFVKCLLPLPLFYAVLLVEIFASDQAASEQCRWDKPFMRKPRIYRFALPVDLPVLVEATSRDQAVLKFADTAVAPAEKIRAQVDFALRIFRTVRLITVTFREVARENLPDGTFLSLAEKSGFALVRTNPVEMFFGFDYQIFAVPNACGQPARAAFEALCKEKFEAAQMWTCQRCGETMSRYLWSLHDECVSYYHPGSQIAFPDGKMEHVSEAAPGETPLKTVLWTCCGETPDDDAGCSQYTSEQGHANPWEEDATIRSQFGFQVQSLV
jgi:hypothetical protein